jgi:hypothetical protein
MNRYLIGMFCLLALSFAPLAAQKQDKKEAWKEPALPDDKTFATDSSPDFLRAPATLSKDVAVAQTPPVVDFAFIPGQTYAGNPWSAWGDSLFADGKYYLSLGDHKAPGGNAFIYEYDPEKHKFRQLLDVRKLLNLPDGDYTPGKIHTQLGKGDDGWIYCGTHRGSTKTTTDAFHYKGDWILRVNPETGKSEVVVQGPVPKHCIPTGLLDAKRLIFYGSTTEGASADGGNVHFFAYDIKAGKTVCDEPDGPQRAMILARSTGRVYYVQGKDDGPLMRYDPAKGGKPVKIDGKLGLRAATEETAANLVYTVSFGEKASDAKLYAFNTKTEAVEELGPAAVGGQNYITALSIDPTGRYIYYVPGAHGAADSDGSPLVQYDVKNKSRKVVAFLHPFFKDKYEFVLKGTYSVACDAKGERVFITWNINRNGGKAWDCVGLTVVHIPATERATK